MTYNEFIKWLKKQGVKIESDKGRHHLKATFKERKVPLPFHGSKEIGEGVRKKIIKDLGL